MPLNYDDILSEVAALTEDGLVDFTNEVHLGLLREALRDRNVDEKFITEYVRNTYYAAEKFLIERSRAAQQAHKLGLMAAGGYRWMNPKTKKVTHITDTKTDSLIPLSKKQSDAETQKSKAAASEKGQEKPPEKGEKEQPQQKQQPKPNVFEPGANIEFKSLDQVRKGVREIESHVKEIPFENTNDKKVFQQFLELAPTGDLSTVKKYSKILNKYIHGSDAGNKLYLAIKQP